MFSFGLARFRLWLWLGACSLFWIQKVEVLFVLFFVLSVLALSKEGELFWARTRVF